MIGGADPRLEIGIRSRICAWIVTSSAVVGSSAIRSFGLQASAMAIITRWRMPPESWCGYSLSAPPRLGDAHQRQHLHGAHAGRVAAEALMQPQRLGDLVAHRQHRIEARHRLLEHHADLRCRECRAWRASDSVKRSRAVETDRAGDPAGRLRHEPQDRIRRHRLAAAALADDRHRLAGCHRERHAVHRADHAVRRAEMCRRFSTRVAPCQRLTAASPCADRARRASRRRAGSPPAPSPRGTPPGRTRCRVSPATARGPRP